MWVQDRDAGVLKVCYHACIHLHLYMDAGAATGEKVWARVWMKVWAQMHGMQREIYRRYIDISRIGWCGDRDKL